MLRCIWRGLDLPHRHQRKPLLAGPRLLHDHEVAVDLLVQANGLKTLFRLAEVLSAVRGCHHVRQLRGVGWRERELLRGARGEVDAGYVEREARGGLDGLTLREGANEPGARMVSLGREVPTD